MRDIKEFLDDEFIAMAVRSGVDMGAWSFWNIMDINPNNKTGFRHVAKYQKRADDDVLFSIKIELFSSMTRQEIVSAMLDAQNKCDTFIRDRTTFQEENH